MSVALQIKLLSLAVVGLWVGWAISWLVAARWFAPVKERASLWQQLPDRLVTIFGALLVGFPTRPGHWFTERLYIYGFPVAWSLVGGIALGIAIAWWARIHLGRYWSGTVTRKEDHKIIQTGPYRFVRHPIYTGLIISFLATAAIKASWIGFIGVAIVTLGFYLKARLEERFLSVELGPDYAAYKARVPMLFPIIGV